MIRVGFLVTYSNEWIGGVNYLRNLHYAISVNPENQIKPIIFMGLIVDSGIRKTLETYAEIVQVPVLTKKSLSWFIWKITKKIFGTDVWLEYVLRQFNVDVFSHSDLQHTLRVKKVNWIPDFQHLHLPFMFSNKEIKSRNKAFKKIAIAADRIILSSKDAENDLRKFIPKVAQKVRVLHFVAQPNRELMKDDLNRENDVLEKFEINEPFFYLPNQFWKHKNHKIVFEALVKLKEYGVEPLLVCSGQASDYRNQEHFDDLRRFIEVSKTRVRFLGLIEYDDVVILIKKSLAVINPSLFEGNLAETL